MRQHLDVHRDHRGARVREGVEVAIRIRDHQVHVERHRRDPLDGCDDGRADRDVRHEVAVHDIHVDQIRAASLDRGDGVASGRPTGSKAR
jgi:hypothetical protein